MDEFTSIVNAAMSLKEQQKSVNFVIHFDYCNALNRRGMGSDGIRIEKLIAHYLEHLELSRSKLRAAPFNRNQPHVEQDGKTHVFVLDTRRIGGNGAFTIQAGDALPIQVVYNEQEFVYGVDAPVIFLPSRFPDNIKLSDALELASVYAVHEVVHIFGFTDLHHAKRISDWEWFDEAYATWIETQLLPARKNYLLLMLAWVDHPSLALMAGLSYRHMPLINYISQLEPDDPLLSRVWSSLDPRETALEALARHLEMKDLIFVSADLQIDDIFASGYCIDSYFLWDSNSKAHNPDIYRRFGPRTLTHRWQLDNAPISSSIYELQSLACRYYRFDLPPEKICEFDVVIQLKDEEPLHELKAFLVEVTAETKAKGAVTPLVAQSNTSTSLSVRLTQEDKTLNIEATDHYVLVVVNCDTSPRNEFDDDNEFPCIRYEIKASIA